MLQSRSQAIHRRDIIAEVSTNFPTQSSVAFQVGMFQIKAATTTNENNTNNPCTLTASTEPPAVSSQYLPVSPVATMGHIKWPPSLLRTDILGEITDTSGRKIARDIGRAVWLGGNCYYAFGDTFCHDVKNEFCGVTNNSIAYVPDPRGAPTQSTYIDYAAGNPGAVRAFVGYTDGEVCTMKGWNGEGGEGSVMMVS